MRIVRLSKTNTFVCLVIDGVETLKEGEAIGEVDSEASIATEL